MKTREYYLHDAENGAPQTAMQLWRDSHTENALAEKFRKHLTAVLNAQTTNTVVTSRAQELTKVYFNEPLKVLP